MTVAPDPHRPVRRLPSRADDQRREQAVARAGAYLEKWADSDDRDDLRALERAERALREALEQR